MTSMNKSILLVDIHLGILYLQENHYQKTQSSKLNYKQQLSKRAMTMAWTEDMKHTVQEEVPAAMLGGKM